MRRGFTINLRGRVNNFTLPKNQPLIPLYEAIVNSLHAIEERRNELADFSAPKIEIQVIREEEYQIGLNNAMTEWPAIQSFVVTDNGVGFNEPNFESFMESDSTYKANIGGKGVGRFSWLTAFAKATIESIYAEDSGYVKRSFEFTKDSSEIDDTLEDWTPVDDNITTITLHNCCNPYQDNLPKRSDTLCMRIIQHCLIYFISPTCPVIDVIDLGKKFNLNQIFNDKIKSGDNNATIEIAEEKFTLLHVKAEDASINGNKLFLCAHNRLVETRELDKYVVDLDREIYQNSGFWYVGVLTSDYLDNNVDMNRLSFAIPEGGIAEDMTNPLSMDQIMSGAVDEIQKYLADYLTPIAEKKNKRVQEYVTHEAPQFRHLLKYMKQDIDNIKPNLTSEKLDDELHRIKRKFDIDVKEQNRKLLLDLNDGAISTDKYSERLKKQVDKVASANGAALAEYVAHRKVILDLLDYAIRKNEDGKFSNEKYVHDLIYPTRSSADEQSYNNHNLWLIDEKLAYCSYITSDIPFNNDYSEERPDILVLDHPVAISENENDGNIFDTIILFELKKPMRDDYTTSSNPVTQLYEYAEKILSGDACDKDGRIIKANSNTKFYLYAICDITPKLEKIIKYNDFKKTPDQLGRYTYNETFNAYVEILPFNKLINDAKKRNRVLFDTLGL